MHPSDYWKNCQYAKQFSPWRIAAYCWSRDALGGPDGALFGCQMVRFSYRTTWTRAAWYKYGEYKADGLWHIDKALLLRALREEVAHRELEDCPDWDWDRPLRVLRNLPDAIDPKHPDWCSVEDWREGMRQAVSVDYVGDVRKLRLRLVRGGKDD